MSKWTKWILVGALVAAPTLGWAVSRYHHAHAACPKGDCPNRHAMMK